MTLVVAHRGASTEAPENTMEAFRLGVEAGADAVELDVHLTADGQLAVIHDDTLDRTTDRGGAVADLTMDDIRRADAGARFARAGDAGTPFAGAGLTVPTLPEVLEWLPDGIGLVVEIKAPVAADAVVDGTSTMDPKFMHASSFDGPAMQLARNVSMTVSSWLGSAGHVEKRYTRFACVLKR